MKNKIWARALRRIEIRPHSAGELAQKLSQEFPAEEETIAEVLNEMKRLELISDQRTAEQFVHYWSQKQVGRIRIMVEARRRHLDQSLVEQLLLESGWDARESAKKALEPKLRTLNESDPRKRKQKLMRFLQNRGFEDRLIFQVLGSMEK